MNIDEAAEAIIALQKTSIGYLLDSVIYQTEIAEILEELLATGGVKRDSVDEAVHQHMRDMEDKDE